jgi:hypothetical protein
MCSTLCRITATLRIVRQIEVQNIALVQASLNHFVIDPEPMAKAMAHQDEPLFADIVSDPT